MQATKMPRYSFRVSHRHPNLISDEALELPNDEAAWKEATTACREMLTDLDGSLHEGSNWLMEVSDDSGPLFRLSFGAEKLRKQGDTRY